MLFYPKNQRTLEIVVSDSEVPCNRPASVAVGHSVTGKLTLMVCELWFASKLSSVSNRNLAAFIGTSGDTFTLILR